MPSGIHMRLTKHRKRITEQNTKHGDKRRNGKTATLYFTWAGMKQRCYNLSSNRYKYYGAKGIQICEEWKQNYQTFKNWAMRFGYKEGLVIHRIDHKKNYQPDNCIFMTKSEHIKLNPTFFVIKITDERIFKAHCLHNQGMRVRQLFQMFSIAESTMSQILRGTGCPRYQKLYKEFQCGKN